MRPCSGASSRNRPAAPQARRRSHLAMQEDNRHSKAFASANGLTVHSLYRLNDLGIPGRSEALRRVHRNNYWRERQHSTTLKHILDPVRRDNGIAEHDDHRGRRRRRGLSTGLPKVHCRIWIDVYPVFWRRDRSQSGLNPDDGRRVCARLPNSNEQCQRVYFRQSSDRDLCYAWGHPSYRPAQ